MRSTQHNCTIFMVTIIVISRLFDIHILDSKNCDLLIKPFDACQVPAGFPSAYVHTVLRWLIIVNFIFDIQVTIGNLEPIEPQHNTNRQPATGNAVHVIVVILQCHTTRSKLYMYYVKLTLWRHLPLALIIHANSVIFDRRPSNYVF